MKTKEIYLIKIRYRDCFDNRPCVLLDVAKDTAIVALISSAIDMFDSKIHFLIPNNHPHFATTGLKRTSYILGDEFKEVKLAELKKYIGKISGSLLIDFEKWLG